MNRSGELLFLSVLLIAGVPAPAHAVHPAPPPAPSPVCRIESAPRGIRLIATAGTIEVEVVDRNILRVDVEPQDQSSPRTLVMDPAFKPVDVPVSFHLVQQEARLEAPAIHVDVQCSPVVHLSIADTAGNRLVEQVDPFGQTKSHSVSLLHSAGENVYGMSGLAMGEKEQSLFRNHGSRVSAGSQGESGAPWFFTTRFGVLIDSDGGVFDTHGDEVRFSGDSRQDQEYFVVAGQPMESMAGLAELTGRPPLPPKWTLGFLNSQWGSTEQELKQIVAGYRTRHIPLDGFILDFDWKAWGEDNYGEWRWNSTSGPGNIGPDKFPDGASGVFGRQLAADGVHLAGILKPRILLYTDDKTKQLTEAAGYAEAHHLWLPNQKDYTDYFTGRATRDLDFSKDETRSWFWQHLAPTFDTGMTAWWNDEADNANNFQFLNMGRMLYDGQRSHANIRVWSINRNNYLGSQRYGSAEWSGDIQTGFQSMARQRMRMLATLDTGQPHWSMDTGGFFGHPTPENYARWMEFAAFVPIDRVHGDIGEKRQPWVYGPVAEAAATKALRLRSSLLPYIYSYERVAHETGIGLVRPLFWEFPLDSASANEGAEWMFGDAFLVSPVVVPGETAHSVYLPPGQWYDYFRGTRLEGGKTISEAVDAVSWKDIPLFVQAGSIVATTPVTDYVDQTPAQEVTLDVFTGQRNAKFVYYDDDGISYDYEVGNYYRQPIEASIEGDVVKVVLDAPTGKYTPAVRTYLFRIHGRPAATEVLVNEKKIVSAAPAQMENWSTRPTWSSGSDRFGPVTMVRVPAGQRATIAIH